jgi:Flp pilus assembly pilin Flp
MRPRTGPVTGLHALAVTALALAVATEPAPRLLATTGVAAVLAAAGATLQVPTAAARGRLARHAALAGGILVVGGALALSFHVATALVAMLAGATSLGAALATGERPAFLERLAESRGQTLYEYAAVTALIAVVCVAAVTTIGQITVPWYVISAL